MEAKINGFTFVVEEHNFWTSFNTNWEIETKKIYQKYTHPDKCILDVGAWIGPTVLIGYSNNAKHIYAVEADPVNAYELKKNCVTNLLSDRVTIINKCIYNKSGEVLRFGSPLSGTDTSTKSFGGERKVLSSTLEDIIKDYSIEIDDVSLIKIDIEGSELFLVDDLYKLSRFKHIVIHLSLHQHYWHRIPANPALPLLYKKYDFFTATEEPIECQNITTYILEHIGASVLLRPKP